MVEYIGREALRSKAVYMHGFGNNKHVPLRASEDAPAVDVAPVVHGEWEAQKYWKYENKHSIQYRTNRCSLCHCDVSSRLLYNYCPNCGARMDGAK